MFVSSWWLRLGLGGAAVVLGLACAAGDEAASSGIRPGDDEAPGSGLTAADDPSSQETGDDPTGGQSGDPQACGQGDAPPCDCEAIDEQGEPLLGPCHPACIDTYRRWSLWTTNYNVSGTLGYGEHQGNAIIGYAYDHDTRFGPQDGIAAPWRTPAGELWSMQSGASDAEQFRMRTQNPGAEVYVDPVVMPGDEDDLWPTETLPTVPISQADAVVEGAALCEPPQVLMDVRHYNHGRTLAQTVPNHGWDSFFTRRSLIPIALLEVIELTSHRDGRWVSPTIITPGPQTADHIDDCMEIIDDGFCDSQCGNCSYVMPTGYSGFPFGAQQPGNQISGIPAGSAAPYQTGDGGQVATRVNWSVPEDGHLVSYVGGSVWGMVDEVAEFADFGGWPDPDGVPASPAGMAWVSMAGADQVGADGVPDQWSDPFTHCLDPSDSAGSQRPAGWPRFITGRWGHNSNSDAEAAYRQFMGCRDDPQVAVLPAWTGSFACDACGAARVDGGGALIQYPCRDKTHTATSYWERSPGTHDIEDFDPGKFDAVDASRMPTDSWAGLPRPICATSGEPVYGM